MKALFLGGPWHEQFQDVSVETATTTRGRPVPPPILMVEQPVDMIPIFEPDLLIEAARPRQTRYAYLGLMTILGPAVASTWTRDPVPVYSCRTEDFE